MQTTEWGLIDYREATEKQLALVEEIARDPSLETVVLCSHQPVVTYGRGSKPKDIFSWSGEMVETSRGGAVTYHGPSQLVMYPILNLSKPHVAFGERDLHGYLRTLEKTVVDLLAEFGIESEARVQTMDDGPSLTGVWVGEKKIASIGIACRKWVTYHGVALNVNYDPTAFTGINPCGMQSSVMTSMEQILDKPVDRAATVAVATALVNKLFAR